MPEEFSKKESDKSQKELQSENHLVSSSGSAESEKSPKKESDPLQKQPQNENHAVSSSEAIEGENGLIPSTTSPKKETTEGNLETYNDDEEFVTIDIDDLSELVASKVVAYKSSFYSGPIPHPDILLGYEEVVPGSAKQIISMAKDEMKHRHLTETKIVDSNISRAWWGLVAGFTLSIVAIAGGLIVVAMGHDTAGATIATAGIATLAGVFVYGTTMKHHERKQGKQQSADQDSADSPQENDRLHRSYLRPFGPQFSRKMSIMGCWGQEPSQYPSLEFEAETDHQSPPAAEFAHG